ncbi:MAG: hypothetical protein ABI591_10070 [Kofleriaceae bacterium]
MKTLSIMFVAALSLAAVGCKKKGGDCTKAIANSMEVAKDSMAGIDKPMLVKMHDLAVSHCQNDKWSDEAIACMTTAKTEAEAQGCYGKLTAEQRDKTNKAAMELAEPPPAAGSGSAAAGSATAGSADAAGSGSAASGSAAAVGSDAGSAAAPK